MGKKTLPPQTSEESNARFEKAIRENIKKLRLGVGMTQAELAKKVGYADKSMIAKIEAGKSTPTLEKLELFADALNTTAMELAGFPPLKLPSPEKMQEEMEISASIERSERMAQLVLDPVVVPLIQHNTVINDKHLEYEHNLIEYVPAPRWVDASIAVKVLDAAMQPAGIPENSTVFVSKENIIYNGEIACVVFDGEVVIRRFYYDEELDLNILQADNPDYPPVIIPGDKDDDLFLVGKIIYVLVEVK